MNTLRGVSSSHRDVVDAARYIDSTIEHSQGGAIPGEGYGGAISIVFDGNLLDIANPNVGYRSIDRVIDWLGIRNVEPEVDLDLGVEGPVEYVDGFLGVPPGLRVLLERGRRRGGLRSNVVGCFERRSRSSTADAGGS
jgi:hypothetical protein